MLHGLGMWCSISDDKGEKDISEEIFEDTEMQIFHKDTGRSDMRSNGAKGRKKEVYANRNISWQ